MAETAAPPSFATLLQRFFAEHLMQHREVSPQTVAAYRDTFRLLLLFAERRTGKAPTAVSLADLDAGLIGHFCPSPRKGKISNSQGPLCKNSSPTRRCRTLIFATLDASISNLASAVVAGTYAGAKSRRFRTRHPPKPLFLPFRGDGH